MDMVRQGVGPILGNEPLAVAMSPAALVLTIGSKSWSARVSWSSSHGFVVGVSGTFPGAYACYSYRGGRRVSR